MIFYLLACLIEYIDILLFIDEKRSSKSKNLFVSYAFFSAGKFDVFLMHIDNMQKIPDLLKKRSNGQVSSYAGIGYGVLLT